MATTIGMMIDELKQYCEAGPNCDCNSCKLRTKFDKEMDELTDMLGCEWKELGDCNIKKCYNWLKEMQGEMKEEATEHTNSTRYIKHTAICAKLTEIYKAKNTDYGNSFGETFKKLGIISAVTRISDKMNRLETLAINHDARVKDEKIEDTLMDMANYAIMTLIELGYEPEN